jgi:hypothetical protein
MFAFTCARSRTLVAALLILGLDLLLFVPSYLFSQPHADLLPFVSADPVPSAYEQLLRLVLRRPNLDVFRISFDFGLLLLVASWTARSRWRAAVRGSVVAAYLLLLLFLAYHHAVSYFYARSPALVEDWRLTRNLLHFVEAMFSPSLLAWLLVGLSGLVAVGVAAHFAIRVLQDHAAAWSGRRHALIGLGLVLPAVASLSWFGVQPDEPVIQWTGKRLVYNWRASRAEALRMAPLRNGAVDRSYDALSKVSLQQKPDFYLFMIEAYGEILATWDMADAYRALLQRVEARLAAAGYRARSAYSAAPVYGGTSWFSIATVHTGIMIDRPMAYSALELAGPRIPSLTHFFKAQGYRTYTLQPGSRQRTGTLRLDLFGHDVVLDAHSLGYRGPHYGWGHIPDQYSLGVLGERFVAPTRQPRYLFYMGVSTHYPWGEDVPPYVRDWKALNHGDRARGIDARWPALPHTQAIASELRTSYLQSIEYEWRVLLDLLEAERSRSIVVVVMGDHQPRLESNPPGEVTMNTPIHVLSRDGAFVESFADAGFQPGLFAEPGLRPALQHEGLFSLWVSKLAAAYAEPGSRAAPYFPDGVGLAGLNR